MRVGFDIDDTVSPLIVLDLERSPIIPCYLEYGKKHFEYRKDARIEDLIKYDHSNICPHSKEELAKLFLIFYKTQEFADIKPYIAAVKAIREVIKRGDEVYFVTARDSSTADVTLKHLLEIHSSLDHRRLYFAKGAYNLDSSSKKDIATNLSLDRFVDDSGRNIISVASAEIHSILFDQPWNKWDKLPNNAERAFSWPHVMACIYDEEKLFRFLIKHKSTSFLPLANSFKALKKEQLKINPKFLRYHKFDSDLANQAKMGSFLGDIVLSAIYTSPLWLPGI